MNRIVTVLAFACAASSTVHAGIPLRAITWAGELRDASGPVNRLVSAIFVVKDGTTTVSQLEDASFDVTGGNIVVDLLVNDAPGLTLEVLINGELLGPSPLSVTWPAALVADRADVADVADSAASIGGVTAPLTKAALATAGQAPFPIGNVADFPPAFLDGDQGIDFVPDSATFTFVDGVLSIKDGSITSAQRSSIAAVDLAAGAVTSDKILDKTVVAADITANLGMEKVANDAIVARHIGSESSRTTLFRVVEAGCIEPVGMLTRSPSCEFTNVGSCTGPGNLPGKRGCDGQTCFLQATSGCSNEAFGALVFK